MNTTNSLLYSRGDYRRVIPLRDEASDLPGDRRRSPFRRDYARLIQSPAFRRLQGKNQLFAGLESDFFMNRITHSLEVAQIAKSIAFRLNVQTLGELGCPLDSDLGEFAGLAHDLGHPPFGHTGEDALNQIIIERTRGTEGFEGNAQTLRLLSRLEKKLDDPTKQLFQGGRRKKRPRWYNSKGHDSP